MNIIKFQIELLMYSDTEIDPNCNHQCLIRKMSDVDISQVSGINTLSGQYCWIYDYDNNYSDKKDIELGYKHDKEWHGFNLKEVIMYTTFKDGHYIAEFATEMPLESIVTLKRYKDSDGVKMTLKDAIKEFLDGNLSDGIGENPIGTVGYNFTTHEVWLGKYKEID